MDTAKITELLKAHSSGDPQALDELMPLVYKQLRKMAHYRLLGERPGHTLNTTDLVHEAYLKLVQFNRINWENRSHFYGMASQIMRNILVDYAVKKKAQKRGGDRQRVTLGKQNLATEINLHDILSIHQALEQLAKIDERQVRVVECRFFGGMTLKETAKALDISTATVSRDWKMARALQLKADLNRQEGKVDQSRALLIEATEILERLKDKHWRRYADIQADRSYVERLDQNYKRAIRILEPIYEEIQNRNDADLELKMDILNFLSGFYSVVGRLHEADRIRNENIKIIEKLEGSESLNYGINLMNSISLKYNLGQFDIAEKRAREAISIFNHIYDEPTGVESVAYGALAATKLYSGQFDEALSALEIANEKWAYSLNKDLDNWPVPNIYRGLMLGQMNRWREAKPKLLQTRDFFDQGHYTMYHNTPDGVLAEALCRSGNTKEGIFILNEMNVDNGQTNDENPVYQAQIYESRARCLVESGSLKKAHQKIKKSLSTMTYPGRAMERAERKQLLAKILIKLDREKEASRHLKKAEQLYLHLELTDHPELARIRSANNELMSYQN